MMFFFRTIAILLLHTVWGVLLYLVAHNVPLYYLTLT